MTTNAEEVKAHLLRLANAPGRVVKELTVNVGEGVSVSLVARRLSLEKMAAIIAAAKREGILTEKGEPVSTEAALELNRRIMARILYLPGAVSPLFTADELEGHDWLEDVLPQVRHAFGGVKEAVEEAKGN